MMAKSGDHETIGAVMCAGSLTGVTSRCAHLPEGWCNLLVLAILWMFIGFPVISAAEPPDSAPAGSAAVTNSPLLLAVLPLSAADGSPESVSSAERIHLELLSRLSRLQAIRVISRRSVLEYRDSDQDVSVIGRALGADRVLTGDVSRLADGSLHIEMRLTDVPSGALTWSAAFLSERTPAGFIEVQGKIARAVLTAMSAPMTDHDLEVLAEALSVTPATYEAYQRAMDIRNSEGLSDAYGQALEAAVAIDPGYTRASAELAGFLSLEYFGTGSQDLKDRVQQILARIRSLSPGSADDLIARTYYTYYIAKDYDEAHLLATQALQRAPSDVGLLELKSWIERRQGDFAAKVETIRLCRKLDPGNPRWTASLIVTLMTAHRYDDARGETESSSSPDLETEYWRSVLDLREHRNVGRWMSEVEALNMKSGGLIPPHIMWDARVANREYGAAEELLSHMQEGVAPAGSGISGKQYLKIVTYFFLQDGTRLASTLTEARATVEKSQEADGDFSDPDAIFSMAFVNAAEGNATETERLMRRWWSAIEHDRARQAMEHDQACRALGMAGATAAAVDCIRSGLARPSVVKPFMEPYLPYYDSMRDEPAFTALLSEIVGGAENP